MHRAIVVEDTQIARSGLISLLRGYPNIEVIGDAENITQAEELITKWQPDLVFLDIQMPGGTAFDLLANLQQLPKVIFTTAYSDFALQAFEYPTVDYLLKPISREKLDKAISKLSVVSKDGEAENTVSGPSASVELLPTSKLFFKDTEKNHIVELQDIILFESCKNHTRVFFGSNKPFVHKALSNIERRLPSNHFFRINRSQVINIQHIRQVRGSSSQGYELDIGLTFSYMVSRRQSVLLKAILSL